MKFEDLQAIWDTQNDRPVFALKDARLAVALYQQRERSRRRVFWKQFAPVYVAAPAMAALAAFLVVAFFYKTRFGINAGDPRASVWDGAAGVVAVGAMLATVALMYAERRKHERTQNVFAPSLREELDRGIAQLDFELGLRSTPRMLRSHGLVSIGAMLSVWESGRLNGVPAPWALSALAAFLVVVAGWIDFSARKKVVERVMQRKRALMAMRAALDESA